MAWELPMAIDRTAIQLAAALALCASAAATPAGYAQGFDPQEQLGPDPKLPEPKQYLFPPMHLAKVVGWKQGEMPSVPQELKIEAIATGLQHPRSLYVLANGDVLVVESKSPGVEPITRPKTIVMNFIESQVTSGGSGASAPSNRITLLRDTNGDGKPDMNM